MLIYKRIYFFQGYIMQIADIEIKGISWPVFLGISVVVVAAMYLDALPKGMVGGFAVVMVLGFLLEYIGDRLPLIKDYLGGGPLIVIFGSALLVYSGVMPASTKAVIDTFMQADDFLTFYICALICGSILGIEARLLVKAGARYVVPLTAAVVCAALLAALVGLLAGTGWREGISYVSFPIMGGGMGAGAIPMAEILHQSNPDTALKDILSMLIPPVALGNVVAIISGGLLDKLGKAFPRLSGEGQLLKGEAPAAEDETSLPVTYTALGIGLLVSCTFMLFGRLAAMVIPGIHYYALMILSVAVFKIFHVLPRSVEQSCTVWFRFVAKYMTAPLLVGIGVTYTDLSLVIDTFSIVNTLQVIAVVLGAVLGAGLGGVLVGFHFIESAISAGLCMANMGGTGDVAVLSASRRMVLMPFAQISSRLGGAIILVLVGPVVPLLMR